MGDRIHVTRHCLPSDNPAHRGVPTLIYDSAAWVKAEYYDDVQVEVERLEAASAGAVEILRELAQMPLRASGKDYDRLVKAARAYLPEYADIGGQ